MAAGLLILACGPGAVRADSARVAVSGSPASPDLPHPGESPHILEGFVEMDESTSAGRDRWNFMLYRGIYSRTTLGEILTAGYTRYHPSYITVLAVNRPLGYRLWRAPLEGEGQIVRHAGIQRHLEFNGVLLARISEPFRGTPFTFAIGEGLSLATRNPDLENPRRDLRDPDVPEETSNNFLNYLVFELEMALPLDAYDPRVFLRVHHRSGVFGIFCPPYCGSNFVSYGVKFAY